MNSIILLLADGWKALTALWRRRRPDQAPLFWLGLILMGSGLFHSGVWILSGGSLEGPVSWRKPISFGFSGGITTLSVGWVLGYFNSRQSLKVSSWIYTFAMGVEVALITLQQWRGVGSHFNNRTPFDSLVFSVMGLLILVVAVVIFRWTWLSFRDLNAPRDLAFAIRTGMVLLNVGNLLGIFLVAYGSFQIQMTPGHPPNIFGIAGMMKVPHAVALHAIQVLPLLAWLFARKEPSRENSMQWVRVATAGYVGILAFTALQTFTGRAPFDFTPLSALLGFTSVATFLVAYGKALFGTRGVSQMEVW